MKLKKPIPEKNPNLFLEKGEKICTECNGWGFIPSVNTEMNEYAVKEYEYEGWARCPRCLGRCALEFIDAAVGKNRDPRWA